MNIRKFQRGIMCLGSVRLLPIDVGFDVRITGDSVILPEDLGDGVGYENPEGIPCVVTGPRDEVIEVLREAGYTIAG